MRASVSMVGGLIVLGCAGFGIGGRASAQGDLGPWTPLGPGDTAGRTRALAIKPDNADVLVAGGVGGGLWRSADGGETWTPTGDSLPNLAITSVIFDPNNANVVYASTGEGFGDVNSIRGRGIYRSDDAGLNWSVLAATVRPEDGNNFHWVNKLAARDIGGGVTELYAAARSGVWMSSDGGASWSIQISNPQSYNGAVAGPAPAEAGFTALGFLDVETAPGYVLASSGSFVPDGIYRRDNAGAWSRVGTQGDLNTIDQGRKEIAIAPSNPDVAYALVAAGDPNSSAFGQLVNLFRSVDGGLTWSARIDTLSGFNGLLLSNLLTTQQSCLDEPPGFVPIPDHRGAFSMALAIDPLDVNTVWIGAADAFRSSDGGINWGVASYNYLVDSSARFVHSDQHLFVFSPGFDGAGNTTMYTASDGGISRTLNARAPVSLNTCPISGDTTPLPAVAWERMNTGYNITRIYDGDVAQSGRVVAAAQDDGALVSDTFGPTTPWNDVLPLFTFDGLPEDAAAIVIDPTDDDVLVYSYAGLFPDVRRSTNGGTTTQLASDGLSGTSSAFVSPMVRDPSMPSRLWTGGERAFRSNDAAVSWEAASPAGGFAGLGSISAIAVAPSNPNVVYLGFNGGLVAVSSNALATQPTWAVRGGDDLPVNSVVSSIAVDPGNPARAIIGYASRNVRQLFETTNTGASFAPIDTFEFLGDQDVPVHSVVIRPTDADQIFVGTEQGLYVSEDRGMNWFPTAPAVSLPNTVVEDLVFQTPDRLLAFTRGRGAFASVLMPSEIVAITPIDGPPSVLPLDEAVTFDVRIEVVADTLVSNPRLEVRVDFDQAPVESFNLTDLGPSPDGGRIWRATIPPFLCGQDPFLRVVAEGAVFGEASFPAVGEFPTEVLSETILIRNSGEADPSWSIVTTANDGAWEAGRPQGNDRGDPAEDADGNGFAWLTDINPSSSNSDVDAGTTVLETSPFELPLGSMLSYSYWFNDDEIAPASDEDFLRVDLIVDGVQVDPPLTLVSGAAGTSDAWRSVTLTTPTDIPSGASAVLRITAGDLGAANVIEAGFDALDVARRECEVCVADVNRDGRLSGADFNAFLTAFLAGSDAADANFDGMLTGADFNAWLINFTLGCDQLRD